MSKRQKTSIMDQYWKQKNRKQDAKNRAERNQQRLQKVAQMDPVDIRVEIRKLERQLNSAADESHRNKLKDQIARLEKGFQLAVVRVKQQEELEAAQAHTRPSADIRVKGLDRLISKKRGAPGDPDDDQSGDEHEAEEDEEEEVFDEDLNIAVEGEDHHAPEGDDIDLLDEFEIPSDMEQGEADVGPPDEAGFMVDDMFPQAGSVAPPRAPEDFDSDDETTLLLMPPGLSPLPQYPPAPFPRVDKRAYLELGRLRPPAPPQVLPPIPPAAFGGFHASPPMMAPFMGPPRAPPMAVPVPMAMPGPPHPGLIMGAAPGPAYHHQGVPPQHTPLPFQPARPPMRHGGGPGRPQPPVDPDQPRLADRSRIQIRRPKQQQQEFDPLAMDHPLYAEDRRTIVKELHRQDAPSRRSPSDPASDGVTASADADGAAPGVGPQPRPAQVVGPQPGASATPSSTAAAAAPPASGADTSNSPKKPSAAPPTVPRPAFVPTALLRPRAAVAGPPKPVPRRNLERIAASLSSNVATPASASAPAGEQVEDEDLDKFMQSIGELA